jgi:glucans biosynthesis protein
VSADRIRNTRAMAASPRCGASTRGGLACRAPAVRGKLRCRMHGGALGSGAPWGNRNARKHGAFTPERIAERRAIRELLDEAGELLKELDSS